MGALVARTLPPTSSPTASVGRPDPEFHAASAPVFASLASSCRISSGPFSKKTSITSVENRSQDSIRTQCSSDLPPSPPCPPCCRTPGSREVSPGCFWFAFLVDPFQRGASAASVDNRSQDSTRTQCSSDLPPSPPCPPCCRTPGSRELSKGFIGLVCACLLFLVGHQLRQLPAFLC